LIFNRLRQEATSRCPAILSGATRRAGDARALGREPVQDNVATRSPTMLMCTRPVLSQPSPANRSSFGPLLAVIPSISVSPATDGGPLCNLPEELRLQNECEPVFAASTGRPEEDNSRRGLRRIVRRVGVAYTAIHDLKRTFVSNLPMARENEAIVQLLVDHRSTDTH